MFPTFTRGIVISATTVNTLLILQLAVSGYLFGLISVVQAEVYPFLQRIDAARFQAFHSLHTKRITMVVGFPMIVELVIAVFLVLTSSPLINEGLSWVGIALVTIIWISTLFVQVPLHQRLERTYAPELTRSLTLTNWIRTVCWAGRVLVAILMLLQI